MCRTPNGGKSPFITLIEIFSCAIAQYNRSSNGCDYFVHFPVVSENPTRHAQRSSRGSYARRRWLAENGEFSILHTQTISNIQYATLSPRRWISITMAVSMMRGEKAQMMRDSRWIINYIMSGESMTWQHFSGTSICDNCIFFSSRSQTSVVKHKTKFRCDNPRCEVTNMSFCLHSGLFALPR